jgi:hypothetical protein
MTIITFRDNKPLTVDSVSFSKADSVNFSKADR